MTDQYSSLTHQHAANALGERHPHAMPAAPASTVPPPPDTREMWSTDEVMGLLNEERAQREQQQQELAQWQHYAQQLQADHAQLQAQYERVSQSTGASIPPGTVSDEHAQNLELQLQAAQERISATEAELHNVRSEAEVAGMQLRMLREHVDSIPPEAPAPGASFPPAAEAHGLAATAFEEPNADYASPMGTGRRFSLAALIAVAGVLLAGGAAAHFTVYAPALEAERETTRRTQELMRSETERLRTQLDEQRAAASKQVQELTKELREAKAAAASAPSGDDGASAATAHKPTAKKRRAPARRRKAHRRGRGKKRASASRKSHANDPIAGIGL